MRQAAFSYSLLWVALAACGGSDKSTNVDAPSGGNIDASSIDAPGGGGGNITITGTAVERTAGGMTPVNGATIAAYQNGNDATPVVMTTSMADGTFSLSVPASGGPLDGYLKATKSGLKDTYLYPPVPISADTVAPVNMISPDTLNLLVLLAIGAGNQQAGKGLIALVVVNGATATSTPVAGVAVTSTPPASASSTDSSRWKTWILRIFLSLTRLAVTLATQPSANRRRRSPSGWSPTGILARRTRRGASAARPSRTVRPRSR